MDKENVLNIEELVQDSHNFNKGTEGGGKIDGTLPQRIRSRPKHSD
jgi:hypothetical protein